MADICDLILDEHETFRRRVAELDEHRNKHQARSSPRSARRWPNLLDLHIATDVELFYPRLLDTGTSAGDETEDAISDHNKIRNTVRRASGAGTGSDEWWQAVGMPGRPTRPQSRGARRPGRLKAHDDRISLASTGRRDAHARRCSHAGGQGDEEPLEPGSAVRRDQLRGGG